VDSVTDVIQLPALLDLMNPVKLEFQAVCIIVEAACAYNECVCVCVLPGQGYYATWRKRAFFVLKSVHTILFGCVCMYVLSSLGHLEKELERTVHAH
jgi:hypothetical protein